MVTCVIIANAGTLSNPKKGSCSATKSAGEMLAISSALSLRKLSVVRRLSASVRSHTLIVSELAVVAGVGGMTTTGRGNCAGGRATSSFGTRLPGSSAHCGSLTMNPRMPWVQMVGHSVPYAAEDCPRGSLERWPCQRKLIPTVVIAD